MLKTLITLMRAQAHNVEQDFADRNALAVLAQQIRDAAADLEDRTEASLGAGRADLAPEAAEALAWLEADRAPINEARASVGAEIARLRRHVADATRRLAELERGRRVAEASEAVRRLRKTRWLQAPNGAALADAEATLRRLRERQAEAVVAEAALASMEEDGPRSVAERMEAEGFGRRTRASAADILDRLRQRAATAPAA